MSSPFVEMPGASLLRFWIDRGLIESPPPVQDLGARLGAWLDVRQAIQLHQCLGAATNAPRAARVRTPDWVESIEHALGELHDAISLDRFAPGLWRNPMPVDVVWDPMVWVEFWEPYRRYLVDHQKQMGLVLGRLRRQARAALSERGGSALALAQMDAVYDQTLTPRETRLLARLAHLYEHRWSAWVKGLDLPPPAPSPAGASTSRPAKPEGLLAFEQEIRQSLLAELQLRAQPLLGLIDAHSSHCP